MKSSYKAATLLLCALCFVLVLFTLVRGHTIALLQPMGLVGAHEKTLMINAVLLMLIVIIPVWILAGFFAWHYRVGNSMAKYDPQWENAFLDEFVWWMIPIEIVLVLGAITWSSTHLLDPHRALEVSGEPVKIQVVALDWKWLFIYPQEGIATVNIIEFPVNRPVDFEITADAPMNSFWIPQLGGQIYAMTGMTTALHLIADHTGTYEGVSANFSGEGFAGMKFKAIAVSQEEYDAWVAGIRAASTTLHALTNDAYDTLAKPSTNVEPNYFSSVSDRFYDTVIMKFMAPVHHIN